MWVEFQSGKETVVENPLCKRGRGGGGRVTKIMSFVKVIMMCLKRKRNDDNERQKRKNQVVSNTIGRENWIIVVRMDVVFLYMASMFGLAT